MLSNLPCAALTTHFNDALDGKLSASAYHFRDGLKRTVSVIGFGFYDKALDALVREFLVAWGRMLSHSSWFEPLQGNRWFRLEGAASYVNHRVITERRRILALEARAAAQEFGALVGYVKEHYREVDFDRLERKAVKDYKAFMTKQSVQ